jgi:hypothetical protein
MAALQLGYRGPDSVVGRPYLTVTLTVMDYALYVFYVFDAWWSHFQQSIYFSNISQRKMNNLSHPSFESPSIPAQTQQRAFYAFYAFYAWWIHFPQSGALVSDSEKLKAYSIYAFNSQ